MQRQQPTLEGFYMWLCSHSGGRQAQVFKYALGRLAREYPELDPRKIILEWFAENLYAYEESLSARKYKREPLQALITAIKKAGPPGKGKGSDSLSGEDEPQRSVFDPLTNIKDESRRVDKGAVAYQQRPQGIGMGAGLPATPDRPTRSTPVPDASRVVEHPQDDKQRARAPEGIVQTAKGSKGDVDEKTPLPERQRKNGSGGFLSVDVSKFLK